MAERAPRDTRQPAQDKTSTRAEADRDPTQAPLPRPAKQIVVIGGGVIGCCTAYYITRHPAFDRTLDFVTILEASKIAGGSSGKAGGLLAAWAEPECLAPQSFRLHADLAKEVHCAKCVADLELTTTGQSPAADERIEAKIDTAILPVELDWVVPGVFRSYEACGNTTDTAQVHPYLFTTAMAELAREAGAETMFCTALGINQNMEEGRVGSVTCEVASHDTPFEIPATEVIIAAGPWASSVYPDASVGGARSHSIVIKPFTTLTDHALDIRTSAQTDYWSESEQGPTIVDMYPRPDGTLYACSFCDASAPLPSTSLEVKPDEKICRGILKSLRAISSIVGESELIIQQACFQPVIIHKGERQRCVGPIVGPAETKGLYLAVAHDSWGIQNGPVSGKVIAELIFDGEARAADLHSLQLEYVLERATHR